MFCFLGFFLEGGCYIDLCSGCHLIPFVFVDMCCSFTKFLCVIVNKRIGFFSPTDCNRPGHMVILLFHVSCFRCSSAYLHGSIS